MGQAGYLCFFSQKLCIHCGLRASLSVWLSYSCLSPQSSKRSKGFWLEVKVSLRCHALVFVPPGMTMPWSSPQPFPSMHSSSSSGIKTHRFLLPTGPFDSKLQLWTVIWEYLGLLVLTFSSPLEWGFKSTQVCSLWRQQRIFLCHTASEKKKSVKWLRQI